MTCLSQICYTFTRCWSALTWYGQTSVTDASDAFAPDVLAYLQKNHESRYFGVHSTFDMHIDGEMCYGIRESLEHAFLYENHAAFKGSRDMRLELDHTSLRSYVTIQMSEDDANLLKSAMMVHPERLFIISSRAIRYVTIDPGADLPHLRWALNMYANDTNM